MQTSWVQLLAREDPARLVAMTPTHRNDAHAPQLLSLRSRAQGPELLKPAHPRAYAPQQEKPLQWEVSAVQLESSHHSLQPEEKARAAMNTQHSYK